MKQLLSLTSIIACLFCSLCFLVKAAGPEHGIGKDKSRKDLYESSGMTKSMSNPKETDTCFNVILLKEDLSNKEFPFFYISHSQLSSSKKTRKM